ncbi:MAG: amidohydrolase family protein [Lachnospiraceae bacterium]|nr:amidohydrolase family protein [Lachnospiraceae bacterium]
MVIDFHTHTFPEKIADRALEKLRAASHIRSYVRGTPEALLEAMDRSGVDLSIVLPVATSAQQVEHINDASARLNEAFAPQELKTIGEKEADRPQLFSFGAMHPDYDGWKSELARIKNLGLRGIKLHPIYQGVDFDDLRFLRILDRCAELGLLVVTHSGYDVGFPGVVNCSPTMVKKAAQTIGTGNDGYQLILAHMGGWRCWEEVCALLPETNVMLDTAFSLDHFEPLQDGYWKQGENGMLTKEQFVEMVHCFGAERFVFGTDSPWSAAERELDFIRETTLTDEEKENILWKNAVRVLCEE